MRFAPPRTLREPWRSPSTIFALLRGLRGEDRTSLAGALGWSTFSGRCGRGWT